MKVAFISQPIDTVMPPYQNSVGACTYGAARELARNANVSIYALKERHCIVAEVAGSLAKMNAPVSEGQSERELNLRLIGASRRDHLFDRGRQIYSRLFHPGSPVSTSGRFFPDYASEIARALAKERPDVIHIQSCSQYAPVLREHNPKSKIVLHLHAEWFSQSNFAVLAKRLAAVDLVTAVSRYITRKTKQDFPTFADRCDTAYNGFDPAEFNRSKDWRTLRTRRQRRILYSGALSPHKGVHVLIEAFLQVLEQYPDARLDLVGLMGTYPLEEVFDIRDQTSYESVERFYRKDRLGLLLSKARRSHGTRLGSYQSYLQAMVPDWASSAITFHGFVPRPKLIDLYYDADAFAFPPVWNEGFGLPPVEAMAAATPVVVTKSGALPETVVDGHTGYLVEKNDAPGLAGALLKLLQDTDRARQFGLNGQRRMQEQFTWEAVAKQMLARYEQLCGAAAVSANGEATVTQSVVA